MAKSKGDRTSVSVETVLHRNTNKSPEVSGRVAKPPFTFIRSITADRSPAPQGGRPHVRTGCAPEATPVTFR